MARIKGKKGNTPENFDEFLRIRETLDEDEYTDYWRGINRLKRETATESDFAVKWNTYNDQWMLEHLRGAAPEKEEVEAVEVAEEAPVKRKRMRVRRIVRASKGWAVRDAKKFGGRVVRVDRNGKRNRRGRHWKAVK